MIVFNNTLLLLILSVILIALRPWEHLRWLTLYILMNAIGFFMYEQAFPFASNAEQYRVYFLLRYVNYLLFLGAAAEILRTEFSKKPWWIYVALGFIAFSVLFLSPWGFYFFVPRVILLAGVAFSMPLAIRGKSIPLFALSFMSIGGLISDVVKFVLMFYDTDLVTSIQQHIDPFWNTANSLILISGALWTAWVQLTKKSPVVLNRDSLIIAGGKPVDEVVVPFPLAANGHEYSPDDEPDGIDMFLKAAAVASALQSKDFFSLQELAIYLSATTEYAEQFLETYKVKKIHPVRGESHWVVAKSNIDSILLGKRRS